MISKVIRAKVTEKNIAEVLRPEDGFGIRPLSLRIFVNGQLLGSFLDSFNWGYFLNMIFFFALGILL